MSETKKEVATEDLSKVGGGLDCSAEEIVKITEALTDAYESLIEFTTYVIERVSGDTPPSP